MGLAYGLTSWDQIWLSRLLPVSFLILVGNWLPIFASALAGAASCFAGLPQWRRGLAVGGLLVVGGFALISPLCGASPVCANRWQGEICLQTTSFTCSAASAATLLRAHGIEATEQEMAELCLTNSRRMGTSWQGLYRGLSLKTLGTAWKVEVFQEGPADLKQSARPVILVACLPRDGWGVNPIYREACGWVPGQPHAVVYFESLDDQTLVMGDPQFGRELWKRADLDVLWSGLGFRLVPR